MNFRQGGAALITALFIMALVVAAAVLMEIQQRMSIHRTMSIFQQDEGQFYQQVFISWAKNTLKQNAADKIEEKFPIKMKKRQYPSISIEGRIDDAQGLFNLNNLIDDKTIPQFQRLLLAINPTMKPAEARLLAQAVHFWLSQPKKIRPIADQTEDRADYYTQQKPPYRVPHLPMASVSELRLVEGFNATLFNKLRPYIIALPGNTGININHAPPPVLTTLGKAGIDLQDAQTLADSVANQPVQTLTEAFENPMIQKAKVDNQQIELTSVYFLATSRITVAKQTIIHYSLIRRKDRPTRLGSQIDIQILWQSLGTL